MTCPEANGIFPHPEFCDRFVQCHGGRPHSMMCGPGTRFDARSKRCDHARNARCQLSRGSPVEEGLTPEESRHHRHTAWPSWEGPGGVTTPTVGGQGAMGIGQQGGRHTPQPSSGLRDIGQATPHTGQAVAHTTFGLASPNAGQAATHTSDATPITGRATQGIGRAIQYVNRSMGIAMGELLEGWQHLRQTPPTGQSVRMRGGQWPWEGYVEVHIGGGTWRPVCDYAGHWSLAEGSVICRQLGYHRGADVTWQGGLEMNASEAAASIMHVQCRGHEESLASCRLDSVGRCDLGRDAVAVRCLKEYRSLCAVNEVPYGGHCYSLARIPAEEGPGHISRELAAKECEAMGGNLIHIMSQEENDFISEWLVLRHPDVVTLMTGGVSTTMARGDVWMWESSQLAMTYSNWWKGWDSEEAKVSGSGRCMVMSRMFECPPGTSSAGHEARSAPPGRPPRMWKWHCKTDYHFWSMSECNLPTHAAICKRNPNDIGCVWNLGMDYGGHASVTRHGNSCIPWDSSLFGSPHPDSRLQGHNLCRNYGGPDGSAVAEGHPWCYVNSEAGWDSCEIPPCRVTENRHSGANGGAVGGEPRKQKQPCGLTEFDCGGACISSDYVCDGLQDCHNGKDEGQEECRRRGLLKEFRRKSSTRLSQRSDPQVLEKWVQVSAEDCARRCLDQERHAQHCPGFSYHFKDEQCLLVTGKKYGDYNSQLKFENKQGWDHYELLPPTVNCRGMFHCKNGTCVDSNKVCNGVNDCDDHSDEVNCSSGDVGFSIRLVGGNASHEGRVEVQAYGRWGVICDDLFGLADADVICRELGFTLGAAEAVLHSGFGSGVLKGSPLFLMDDVECSGSEKSLSECQFTGWGDHNCGPEEVVGVVCKVPGSVCPDDQFHCHHSKECIPLEYLCDNLKDCEDGSDEDEAQCQAEVVIRLADGPSNLEGRVEVRYNGFWGTICDDDFGIDDAQVICRSLGLGWGHGIVALKEAHYGPGKGPIWLDELHCTGREESLLECPRFPWGKNNCGHEEDASVKCTPPGNVNDTVLAMSTSLIPQASSSNAKEEEHIPLSKSTEDILPSGCTTNSSVWMRAFGVRGHAGESNALQPQPKVIGGRDFQLGPIPWQASLRVRTGPAKSVHWCGAVVLSPVLALTAGHCVQDYAKEAYLLRVGDYDSKLDEGTEQEVMIAEVYIHEDFNKGPYLNNDIALLKLKAPPGIHFGEQVHGVCLPMAEEGSSKWGKLPSKECVISGWGSVGSGGAGFSRTLRSAVIPLLNQSTCRAAHVYGGKAIGDGMGCAGSLHEGAADSCQGDSGGPLVCFDQGNKPILYGITSWGQGCGRANKPGVYSRISFHRNWIDKKVQEAMSGM